jgi:hypothetical protein
MCQTEAQCAVANVAKNMPEASAASNEPLSDSIRSEGNIFKVRVRTTRGCIRATRQVSARASADESLCLGVTRGRERRDDKGGRERQVDPSSVAPARQGGISAIPS